MDYLVIDLCLTIETSTDLARNLIKGLQNKYSPHVISRSLIDLHAACNLALKRQLITFNPLVGYRDYLPPMPRSKRSKECFSLQEVEIILGAFKNSRIAILPCYADFVEFLFLTGVRPQAAIALTWGDIDKDKITFDKGFTNGVKTDGKNGRVTHYPLYPQLKELVDKLRIQDGANIHWPRENDELVFPNPGGKYINLRSFTRDIWKPVITELVATGKISKYLPTYNCRHSTATFLAKAGIPSSTIAALLDTSEKMLNEHYWDNQELTKVAIPNFLGR